MVVSAEDLNRTALYSQIQKSSLEKVGFEDYNEYLRSLSMACYFWQINEKNVERVTQLIGKTNQFNLTTWRLSESEVTAICKDPSWIAICGRLVDKFGDQGIITVLMGSIEEDFLDIKVWILSCRVFSRHVEFALFDEVVKICQEKKIARITGTYKPTVKNRTVYNLYHSLGFQMTGETGEGITTWEYSVPAGYEKKNKVMESRYDA
jgi:FkbH-like protein